MKGSLAKAIRTIDALRLKKEALEGVQAVAEVKVAEVPAVADVQAVTETVEAEVPASVEAEASAPVETAETTPETPEA
jgi:large subunit ribosomal protein L10